jgi:hypothetical protein
MNEYLSKEQFNQKLDRILQGLPSGSEKFRLEDRRALALAKRASQIDLSRQSKVQEKLRQRLEKLALQQLPRNSSLSLKLLFKPKRLTWIGLVVLAQLVLGSLFGYMSEYSQAADSFRAIGCVTPPTSLSLTQRPETDATGWIVQNSNGSEPHPDLENPQPVPTPLAPPTRMTFPQDATSSMATPLMAQNRIGP